MDMKIREIISVLEKFAPLQLQEDYDNSGLQTGDPDMEVASALLTLDVTEAVIEEAIHRNAGLVVAHHPLIFGSLRSITPKNYVGRILLKAIQNNISIYAAHTNLDNMYEGVNALIAQKMGLHNTRILQPKKGILKKLYTYVPVEAAEKVREALFVSGAGSLGKYRECSYNINGTGTFRPEKEANPAIGVAGGAREQVAEIKIEVLLTHYQERQVLAALFSVHPYEEVAYELITLDNADQYIGAGMIGELNQAVSVQDFLKMVKDTMKAGCIRYTSFPDKMVKKVAVCGGSGSFLLKDAIAMGADAFVTADFKYHQFFDADGRILIADIGHYESEQYTPEIFRKLILEKFPNFAVLLSNTITNPVNYFC